MSDKKNLKKLMDYYVGKHDILNQSKQANAPNNKIVANMAQYVTNTATGYFIGQPVVYSSINGKFMEKIQEIFDYNDEQDHNSELAKWNSIYGSSVEMLYIDEDNNIRFTKINPKDVIFIYENTYSSPLAVIRKIVTVDIDGNESTSAEYWTDEKVEYYEFKNGNVTLTETKDHYFKDVPFVEYINNEERIGDFETIISLNDAYNKAQSNTANFFEYNDDAILKVVKMGGATIDDIVEMRKKGAILLEDGGDIDWLIKIINDVALENHKTRLKEDMHNFSNVPNLNDEKFGGNTSGIAIDYKLWGLEQICAIKERKFKKGLQRRIEIITNILNIKGGKFSYMDIKMTFRRNKPRNLVEATDVVTKLNGEVSQETRLQMLPFIENPKEEVKKLELESKNGRSDYGTTKEVTHFEGADDE